MTETFTSRIVFPSSPELCQWFGSDTDRLLPIPTINYAPDLQQAIGQSALHGIPQKQVYQHWHNAACYNYSVISAAFSDQDDRNAVGLTFARYGRTEKRPHVEYLLLVMRYVKTTASISPYNRKTNHIAGNDPATLPPSELARAVEISRAALTGLIDYAQENDIHFITQISGEFVPLSRADKFRNIFTPAGFDREPQRAREIVWTDLSLDH